MRIYGFPTGAFKTAPIKLQFKHLNPWEVDPFTSIRLFCPITIGGTLKGTVGSLPAQTSAFLSLETTPSKAANYELGTHMTTASDSSYIRSVNDYTISSHQIYSSISGKQTPSYTVISHIKAIPLNSVPKVIEYIKQSVESENYKFDRINSIDYDDGQEEKDNYSIYHQSVLSFVNYGEVFVVEIIAGLDMMHIAFMSESKDSIDAITNKFAEFSATVKCKAKVKENTFYTISRGTLGFDLESLKLNTEHSNEIIFDNYNDDFQKAHEVITESIREDKKGLILLHGIPGSGKTSYIKHLITGGSTRKIIYIPPHLASAIASPAFIKFVKEQLSGCVLVIEDAEQILLSRDSAESHKEAVSNILNLTDGILAEALNILIVCTFNTDLENLDKALLRKGRLLLQYKFEELSAIKADLLATKLYGKKVGKSMPLCDIFNLDYELITPKSPSKVKFGFV